MQQRFLIPLIAPFLACSGFLQAPAIANSKYEPIVKETKSPLPTLPVHGDIQQHQPLSDSLNPLLSLSPEQAGVVPFQPDCQARDQLCAVWVEFRTPYPYPTQRIAAKAVSDDEMVIIISEPSNRLNKQQWQDFIAAVFADDLLEYRTFKWMIGFDGWVEDIVVRVQNPDLPQDGLLNHRLTRDRIALINMAMFGSAAGTSVERIESNQSPGNISQIPNLKVSASEVLDWVTDQGIDWQALDKPSNTANHWSDPTSAGTRQVLISADQTLVLFTFPASDILTARNTGSLPEELRTAFRAFAVSSDVLIGGAWSNEQVAILARSRQVPLEDFPPLRVETFELIATQKTTELYQSYERNNLFAGKLEFFRQ
jgi:hypothetical protein